MLAMLKTDVVDGEIRVIQEKTRKPLWIPLHRDLQSVQVQMRQAAQELQTLQISKHQLVNSHGAEWTKDGFKASWQTEMQRKISALQDTQGSYFMA